MSLVILDRNKGGQQVKPRNRASLACVRCRTRKVRCDVALHGQPCMNCHMDEEKCEVTKRAKLRHQQKHGTLKCRLENVQGEDQNYSPHTSTDQSGSQDQDEHIQFGVSEEVMAGTPIGGITPSTRQDPERTMGSNSIADIGEWDGDAPTTFPHSRSPQHPKQSAMVSCYTYSFVQRPGLFHTAIQDVQHLESEGCFLLPTPEILDHFMRQYFTHIQPMLPMLSETDFWEAFTTPTPHESKMSSLFLVQSMLFAACSTVSSSTLAQLGYSSTRQTRASFYRKAKLLYDMGVETSAMATAQAALLLTFWNPPSRADLKPNTMWLMIATENAKKAKADRYAESTDVSMADSTKASQLRRLWWCCIIRDRILPLGLRRSPQITSAHFDLEKNMEIGFKDLQAEILRSKMHSEATLKTLAIIIERVVKLSVILTDVLLMAFPLKGAAHPDQIPQSQIKRCKAALSQWYDTLPLETGTRFIAMADPAAALHQAVMHIYFHWANIVMSHLSIRRAGVIQPRASLRRCIAEAQKEAQKSTVSIVENLDLLNELGLAEKLPITIAAFVAFPLAVHVFEATCSDMFMSKPCAAAEKPLFRQRLSALVKAMKALHAQYDGVEEVVRNIRRIVDYVRLKSNIGEATDKAVSSGQLFNDVALELRVSLAIDWSLSSGRPADGSDFTTYLGEMFHPSPTTGSEDSPTTPSDIRDIHESSTDGALNETATASQQGGADWTASVPPLMADDTTPTWSNLYLPLQQYCFEPLEGDGCPTEGCVEDPDIERMIDGILGDPGRAYFDDLFLPT